MPGELLFNAVAGIGDRLWNAAETRSLINYKYKKQAAANAEQRRYDSPSAQMERMKAAGLNPDLAYSQMAAGSPQPSLETDSASGSNFAGAVGTAMRLKQEQEMTDSNIAVNDSIINKNAADAERSRSSAAYYDRLTKFQDVKEELARHNITLTDKQIENLDQSIQESVSRVKLNQANIDYIGSKKMEQDIRNSKMEQLLDAQINEMLDNAELLRTKTNQIRQAIQQTALSFAQEYKILCNERAISDRQKAVIYAKLTEEAYKHLQLNGCIYYDEKTGQYELTDQGRNTFAADLAINKVGQVVSFMVDMVSSFYSHHTFKNLTPTESKSYVESDWEEQTWDKEGGRKTTFRKNSRKYQ